MRKATTTFLDKSDPSTGMHGPRKAAVMERRSAGSAGASGVGARHDADDSLHFFVRTCGAKKTLAMHARPEDTVGELLQMLQ